MASYKIYKETALPGVLQANSIYLVAPAGSPQFVEMYVTGTTASTVKRIVTNTDVQNMINSTIAGANELLIVNNIGARDALNNPTPMPTAKFVYVVDATADTTVASGGATYLWNNNTATWVKTSEGESMDAILQWDKIQGRPTSTVAAIDDAVAKVHVHSNKTQLDKVGEDGQGNFTYNGIPPTVSWTNAAW
jgi:hypothetical protein